MVQEDVSDKKPLLGNLNFSRTRSTTPVSVRIFHDQEIYLTVFLFCLCWPVIGLGANSVKRGYKRDQSISVEKIK